MCWSRVVALCAWMHMCVAYPSVAAGKRPCHRALLTLCRLLMRQLCEGLGVAPCPNANRVHMDLVAQLCAGGLWPWAVYVATLLDDGTPATSPDSGDTSRPSSTAAPKAAASADAIVLDDDEEPELVEDHATTAPNSAPASSRGSVAVSLRDAVVQRLLLVYAAPPPPVASLADALGATGVPDPFAAWAPPEAFVVRSLGVPARWLHDVKVTHSPRPCISLSFAAQHSSRAECLETRINVNIYTEHAWQKQPMFRAAKRKFQLSWKRALCISNVKQTALQTHGQVPLLATLHAPSSTLFWRRANFVVTPSPFSLPPSPLKACIRSVHRPSRFYTNTSRLLVALGYDPCNIDFRIQAFPPPLVPFSSLCQCSRCGPWARGRLMCVPPSIMRCWPTAGTALMPFWPNASRRASSLRPPWLPRCLRSPRLSPHPLSNRCRRPYASCASPCAYWPLRRSAHTKPRLTQRCLVKWDGEQPRTSAPPKEHCT